jgi:hypothetical protein
MGEINFPDDTDLPNVERPTPGDRVKLFGNHRWAGYTGIYIGDRPGTLFGSKPIVKIEQTGDETIVFDPDNQMRKI